MAIPLTQYVQIKENYCLVYLGLNENHLKNLLIARQLIEDQLLGLKIHIVYNNQLFHLVTGTERTLPYALLKDNLHNFAYIRELKDNLITDPVEEFLKECGLAAYISSDRRPQPL